MRDLELHPLQKGSGDLSTYGEQGALSFSPWFPIEAFQHLTEGLRGQASTGQEESEVPAKPMEKLAAPPLTCCFPGSGGSPPSPIPHGAAPQRARLSRKDDMVLLGSRVFTQG